MLKLPLGTSTQLSVQVSPGLWGQGCSASRGAWLGSVLEEDAVVVLALPLGLVEEVVGSGVGCSASAAGVSTQTRHAPVAHAVLATPGPRWPLSGCANSAASVPDDQSAGPLAVVLLQQLERWTCPPPGPTPVKQPFAAAHSAAAASSATTSGGHVN